MELAPLTVLNKKYSIKRTLGDPGPFDIRYLGQDVDSKEPFVIREYFPVDVAKRESGKTSIEVTGGEEAESLFESGLGYFRKESEVLAGLEHDALPSQLDVFEANGTCYRARPDQASTTLAKGLASKGQLSEKAALMIMVPILEALHVAHEAGLYHGAVSPETVRLLEGGDVLLTGFRGAQIQLARSADKLDQIRQPGYSAIEQYTPRANQGPWTDVYAAAATICTMVTGEPVPEASERLEGDDPLHTLLEDTAVSFSPGVREALMEALTVDPSKRLQSVDALRNALEESSERYDSTEAAYAIISVEDEESADGEAGDADEDDEIEVLTTASGDRPARAQRTPEEKSSLSTVLLVGIPLLLLGIGGGVWFASGDSGPAGTYADYRAQADSLYGEGEYNEAESFYNQALEVRPEDPYVIEQLRSISEQQAQSAEARYVEQVDRGEELTERADNFYENNNYEEANTLYGQALAAYYNAVDLSPDSARTVEAEERIAAIQEQQRSMLSEQAESAGGGSGGLGPQELYDFFIEEGERQYEQGNLLAARGSYQDALEYRSSDPYAEQRIETINAELEEEESQEEFQDLLDRAERLMQTSNYADAQEALEQAVQLNPDNAQLQEMMSQNEELLAEQQQQEERFDQLRTQADNALQEGNYEEAISLYRQAYEINPDSDEVVERLQRAQREYEEMQMAAQRQQREAQRSEEDEETGERIYTVVDQEPAPVGGLAALTQNASYPERAARRGVEGRVYVQAVVNADGSVREAELIRGIGYGCDREALSVVREAEFEPAQVSGRAVASRTTVWVQFSLSGD
jgi:TonB family protein